MTRCKQKFVAIVPKGNTSLALVTEVSNMIVALGVGMQMTEGHVAEAIGHTYHNQD